MEPLGTARPTCERCGQALKIEMFGEPDPDIPGDITQIHFKLPARHACHASRPRPGTVVDLREARSPGEDGP